jgi:hypothetical protein
MTRPIIFRDTPGKVTVTQIQRPVEFPAPGGLESPGHGHAAVLAAGAANGYSQIGLAFLLIEGQQIGQHFQKTPEKTPGFRGAHHIIAHGLIAAVQGAQFIVIKGVGQEAHIHHEISLRGQTIFEAEGQNFHGHGPAGAHLPEAFHDQFS